MQTNVSFLKQATSRLGFRMRRLGYMFRFVSWALNLVVEQPALFALVTLVLALASTMLVGMILDRPRPLAWRIPLAACAALLPIALGFYIYLRNVSRRHRADLAIRALRHSDVAVIKYMAKAIRRAVIGVPSLPLPNERSRDIETNFAASRAYFARVVLHVVALHFRVSVSLLEDLFGVAMRTLETRTVRRVQLAYQLARRSVGDSAESIEADRIDDCGKRILDRVHVIRRSQVAREIGRLFRDVVREPSTGRALAASGEILASHVGKDTFTFLMKLLDMRPGVRMANLLGIDHERERSAVERKALEHYLRHGRSFQRDTSDKTMRRAADVLIKEVGGSRLILTVGFSQIVALTLEKLAKVRKDIVVGIVSVEKDPQWERVAFDGEDRDMEAELTSEAALHGRVFRTSLDEVKELSLNLDGAVIVMGAEAVTPEGIALHPRGRLGMHRTLSTLLGKERRRFVVCESFKVIAVSREERMCRLVAAFGAEDYECVITDQGTFKPGVTDGLGELRAKWERQIDTWSEEHVGAKVFGPGGTH